MEVLPDSPGKRKGDSVCCLHGSKCLNEFNSPSQHLNSCCEGQSESSSGCIVTQIPLLRSEDNVEQPSFPLFTSVSDNDMVPPDYFPGENVNHFDYILNENKFENDVRDINQVDFLSLNSKIEQQPKSDKLSLKETSLRRSTSSPLFTVEDALSILETPVAHSQSKRRTAPRRRLHSFSQSPNFTCTNKKMKKFSYELNNLDCSNGELKNYQEKTLPCTCVTKSPSHLSQSTLNSQPLLPFSQFANVISQFPDDSSHLSPTVNNSDLKYLYNSSYCVSRVSENESPPNSSIFVSQASEHEVADNQPTNKKSELNAYLCSDDDNPEESMQWCNIIDADALNINKCLTPSLSKKRCYTEDDYDSELVPVEKCPRDEENMLNEFTSDKKLTIETNAIVRSAVIKNLDECTVSNDEKLSSISQFFTDSLVNDLNCISSPIKPVNIRATEDVILKHNSQTSVNALQLGDNDRHAVNSNECVSPLKSNIVNCKLISVISNNVTKDCSLIDYELDRLEPNCDNSCLLVSDNNDLLQAIKTIDISEINNSPKMMTMADDNLTSNAQIYTTRMHNLPGLSVENNDTVNKMASYSNSPGSMHLVSATLKENALPMQGIKKAGHIKQKFVYPRLANVTSGNLDNCMKSSLFVKEDKLSREDQTKIKQVKLLTCNEAIDDDRISIVNVLPREKELVAEYKKSSDSTSNCISSSSKVLWSSENNVVHNEAIGHVDLLEKNCLKSAENDNLPKEKPTLNNNIIHHVKEIGTSALNTTNNLNNFEDSSTYVSADISSAASNNNHSKIDHTIDSNLSTVGFSTAAGRKLTVDASKVECYNSWFEDASYAKPSGKLGVLSSSYGLNNMVNSECNKVLNKNTLFTLSSTKNCVDVTVSVQSINQASSKRLEKITPSEKIPLHLDLNKSGIGLAFGQKLSIDDVKVGLDTNCLTEDTGDKFMSHSLPERSAINCVADICVVEKKQFVDIGFVSASGQKLNVSKEKMHQYSRWLFDDVILPQSSQLTKCNVANNSLNKPFECNIISFQNNDDKTGEEVDLSHKTNALQFMDEQSDELKKCNNDCRKTDNLSSMKINTDCRKTANLSSTKINKDCEKPENLSAIKINTVADSSVVANCFVSFNELTDSQWQEVNESVAVMEQCIDNFSQFIQPVKSAIQCCNGDNFQMSNDMCNNKKASMSKNFTAFLNSSNSEDSVFMKPILNEAVQPQLDAEHNMELNSFAEVHNTQLLAEEMPSSPVFGNTCDSLPVISHSDCEKSDVFENHLQVEDTDNCIIAFTDDEKNVASTHHMKTNSFKKSNNLEFLKCDSKISYCISEIPPLDEILAKGETSFRCCPINNSLPICEDNNYDFCDEMNDSLCDLKLIHYFQSESNLCDFQVIKSSANNRDTAVINNVAEECDALFKNKLTKDLTDKCDVSLAVNKSTQEKVINNCTVIDDNADNLACKFRTAFKNPIDNCHITVDNLFSEKLDASVVDNNGISDMAMVTSSNDCDSISNQYDFTNESVGISSQNDYVSLPSPVFSESLLLDYVESNDVDDVKNEIKQLACAVVNNNSLSTCQMSTCKQVSVSDDNCVVNNFANNVDLKFIFNSDSELINEASTAFIKESMIDSKVISPTCVNKTSIDSKATTCTTDCHIDLLQTDKSVTCKGLISMNSCNSSIGEIIPQSYMKYDPNNNDKNDVVNKKSCFLHTKTVASSKVTSADVLRRCKHFFNDEPNNVHDLSSLDMSSVTSAQAACVNVLRSSATDIPGLNNFTCSAEINFSNSFENSNSTRQLEMCNFSTAAIAVIQSKMKNSNFSTASGKSLCVSEEALHTSTRLLSDDAIFDDNVEKPLQNVSFYSNSKSRSSFVEYDTVMVVDFDSQSTAADATMNDGMAANLNDVGFSLVSGKKIRLSEEAILRGKKLLLDDDSIKYAGGLEDKFQLRKNTSGIIELDATSYCVQDNKKIDKGLTVCSECDQNENGFSYVMSSSLITSNTDKTLHDAYSCVLANSDVDNNQPLDKNFVTDNNYLLSGFSTASGKKVHVSNESIARSKQLLNGDEKISCDNKSVFISKTDIDKQISVTENIYSTCVKDQSVSVNSYSIENSFIPGFSTASGKRVHVSVESIAKCKQLLYADENSHNNVKMSTRETIANRQVSAVENKCILSCAKPHVDTNSSNDSNNLFSGFSTASGKKVNVSDESIAKSKLLLSSNDENECNDREGLRGEADTENVATPSYYSKPGDCFLGFLTGSGKKVNVSDESIAKSKLLLSSSNENNKWKECLREIDTENIATQSYHSKPGDSSPCANANSCFPGFLTGSGKKVNVSDESVAKSKLLLNCDENFNEKDGVFLQNPDVVKNINVTEKISTCVGKKAGKKSEVLSVRGINTWSSVCLTPHIECSKSSMNSILNANNNLTKTPTIASNDDANLRTVHCSSEHKNSSRSNNINGCEKEKVTQLHSNTSFCDINLSTSLRNEKLFKGEQYYSPYKSCRKSILTSEEGKLSFIVGLITY